MFSSSSSFSKSAFMHCSFLRLTNFSYSSFSLSVLCAGFLSAMQTSSFLISMSTSLVLSS